MAGHASPSTDRLLCTRSSRSTSVRSIWREDRPLDVVAVIASSRRGRPAREIGSATVPLTGESTRGGRLVAPASGPDPRAAGRLAAVVVCAPTRATPLLETIQSVDADVPADVEVLIV